MNVEKRLYKFYLTIEKPEMKDVIPQETEYDKKNKKFSSRFWKILPITVFVVVIVIVFLKKGILYRSDALQNDFVEDGGNADEATESCSIGLTKTEEDATADDDYPWAIFYVYVLDDAVKIVKGTYVDSSEYNDGDKDYIVYNILVDEILKGDVNIKNKVSVITEKKDTFEIDKKPDTFGMERYKSATIGFFMQLQPEDEILLLLRDSDVKDVNTEESFYEIVSEVYYVDKDSNILHLKYPEMETFQVCQQEGIALRDHWRKTYVNIEQLRAFIKKTNQTLPYK